MNSKKSGRRGFLKGGAALAGLAAGGGRLAEGQTQETPAKKIDELIAYGFGAFQLSPQSRARLKDIAVFAVVKDLFLEDVTGLVFAGFGADVVFVVAEVTDGLAAADLDDQIRELVEDVAVVGDDDGGFGAD